MGLRESLITLAKEEGRPNARTVIDEWMGCLEAIGEAACEANDAYCCQAVNTLQEAVGSAARRIESMEEFDDEPITMDGCPESIDSDPGL